MHTLMQAKIMRGTARRACDECRTNAVSQSQVDKQQNFTTYHPLLIPSFNVIDSTFAPDTMPEAASSQTHHIQKAYDLLLY